MNAEHNGFLKFSEGEQLLPQEETLDIHVNPKNITIGVPAETSFQECRLPLVPQAVGLLVANGHQVIIENDAGKSAHFSNKDFTEVGARVVYSTEEVFKADIILKVAPLSDSEIEMLSSRQTILSSLHITGQNRHYFDTQKAACYTPRPG